MLRFSFTLITILSFFQQGASPGPALPVFDTYCNARFGYCIRYPKDLLYPQREADNGDGRKFNNKAGKPVLLVYGRINADNITLQQQFNEDVLSFKNGQSKGVITYKKADKGFYVISGYRDGKIFYQKTIIKADAFCFALLEYDSRERKTYDGITEEVFTSFK